MTSALPAGRLDPLETHMTHTPDQTADEEIR